MRYVSLILVFVGVSCVNARHIKYIQSGITTQDSTILITPTGQNSIEFSYTGCGGFVLKHDSGSLMVDPYFSNLSPLPFIYFKKLAPDTHLIDSYFNENFASNRGKSDIKTLLISHAHYDHLADVPTIVQRHLASHNTEIFGNQTTHHLLDYYDVNSQIISQEKTQELVAVSDPHFRVYALKSEHAPHLFGLKLLPKYNLTQSIVKPPNRIKRMPEGQNFNFLIDVLDDTGKVVFRVFSNSGGSSKDEMGLPSKSILAERQVDVLVLCAANFRNGADYPSAVIQKVRPKYVVFTHWENFFRPIPSKQEKIRGVPFTNLKKLDQRLRHIQETLVFNYTYPYPLINLTFVYD